MKKKSPLLSIFLVVFLDLVGFGIVIPILPYYAKSYGATALQMGFLMTCYSGMQFLFAPFWGSLSDRFGRRPILLITILGSALSSLFLGLSQTLTQLYLARIFAGFCGANISTASAYIADSTTEENRTKGMGIIGAGFGLGFIFGPAIGGIFSQFGMNIPMFIASGLSLLNLLLSFFHLKESLTSVELRSKNRVRRFDLGTIKESFGNPKTQLSILVFFLSTIAMTQMEVSFAYFMLQKHGINAQGAGWFLAFLGLIMAFVQGGGAGKLSKILGEPPLILIGLFTMACSLFLFGSSESMRFVWLSLFFLAFGNGLLSPSLSSLASKGALEHRRGATLGVYQSAGSLARIIGPPTAGWLFDHWGMSFPFYIAAEVSILAYFLFYFRGKKLFANSPVGSLQADLTLNFSAGTFLKTVPSLVKEAKSIWKEKGFKGVLQRFGWKLVILIFCYYLTRDILIYVVLPILAAKGILSIPSCR
jgi:multidrug resistance protein